MAGKEYAKEQMLKIIEEKKAKSAAQSGLKRSPENLGSAQKGKKQRKKGGGMFDK